MNKKGILALKVLIELVLAISGAVLLAFFLSNIYGLLFPGVHIGSGAEGTVTEMAKITDQWSDLDKKYLYTYVPFALEEERVLMGFGKQEGSIKAASGVDVAKPQDPQCEGKSCICIFKAIGISEEYVPSTGKYLFPQNYKRPDQLIKCWEIKAVDQIFGTLTWKPDPEGFKANRYYGLYPPEGLMKEDNLRNFAFSQSNVGGQAKSQGKVNGFFHDVTYSNIIVHGGPETAGDTVMSHPEGQLGPLNIYLEKTTIDGVRTLFITPATDVTIPHRQTAGDKL